MDITSIVEAVISLLMAILTTVVVPWIKAKTDEKNLEKALTLVDIAVAAAEQIYEVTEPEKKRRFVKNYLASRGLKIDDDSIELMIEASVLELHKVLAE